MANLFKRKSSPSPLCPICKSHEETVEHLFLNCPWVEAIWFGGGYSLRISRTDVTTWPNWLRQTLASVISSNEVRSNIFSHIAFTCWNIWKSRCNYQFNNQQIQPRQVIVMSSMSANAFKESRSLLSSLPNLSSSDISDGCRWNPPCPGLIKINVDASWCRDEGGFKGVVARDEMGQFLAAGRYSGKATNVAMMEALAILHGCRLGKTQGWSSIIIESDSLESISCLKDTTLRGSWDAFPILQKCYRMGQVFLDCRWSWVPRLANSAANLLASRCCREVCDQVWVDRPPSSLVHVLCNDGLPCPP